MSGTEGIWESPRALSDEVSSSTLCVGGIVFPFMIEKGRESLCSATAKAMRGGQFRECSCAEKVVE